MPTAMVKKVAKETGKSVGEVEKIWNQAKAQASKYAREGSTKFFAITTGIFKKMLGKKVSKKLGWESKATKILRLTGDSDGEKIV